MMPGEEKTAHGGAFFGKKKAPCAPFRAAASDRKGRANWQKNGEEKEIGCVNMN